MYTIITNTFIPYTFEDINECVKYIKDMSFNILYSIRLIEKTPERLIIRCPVSGEYLDIHGSESAIDWLDDELISQNLYRR